MSSKSRITSLSTPIESSIQSLEDGNQHLAMQIQTSEVEQLRQEIAELRRNKVPKNDEQIHSAKINTPSIPTTPIKSSIQSLESGNQSLVYRNPVTDIVNLAIQIQDK
jgi:hypothetical protein